MNAAINKRRIPLTDGSVPTEFVIAVPGGYLDYLSRVTADINRARGFSDEETAEGVAEREGYTVIKD